MKCPLTGCDCLTCEPGPCVLVAPRAATEAEMRAQCESWVRGEMAIGLDRDEAAARAAIKREASRGEYA